jgi:hypothetical protein
MATIDTSDLEAEDTTVVELDDKNGNELFDKQGNRRSITTWGPGSRAFIEAQSRANVRNVARIQKAGRTKADADADVAHKALFLSEITISFNNFGISDEDQVTKTFREFYANTKVGYITDKVNGAAGNWANF